MKSALLLFAVGVVAVVVSVLFDQSFALDSDWDVVYWAGVALMGCGGYRLGRSAC